ncbi:hypothetical protein H5410_033982 [Solanum commersonii]|uniref:Uncharacterized protein n=1 Tax=Solanum commersonii TaxID=4109 RepID=A0A9J5YU76_SOLCO|nr:hypothetical protein H5410_033982 [Solanum commersonii]
MASESRLEELNFVLIPLLAVSHIIPMVDIAKLLAQRGVIVTLVMTPLNAIRFTTVIDRAIDSGLLIRVLHLRFPAKEAGLPEGCESVDLLPDLAYRRNFFTAIDMLQDQAEKLLQEMRPKPSCIISDLHIAWTAETADKFQIPRIIFDGTSCFNQLCMHNLYIMKDQNRIPESGHFVISDLPDRIEVTKVQLPGAFNPSSLHVQDIRDKIRAAEICTYGVLINTFAELEENYVDEFRKLKNGRVWCIGPLSLCNNESLDKAQRGNKTSFDEEDRLKKWLDSWQPESVVYACLGSLSHTTVVQFVELALGLEASENGFEERTKEIGLLIRGWAPQVVILSHPAIGGFLTHCGWNSSLEGISAGVPMITWPLFAEQFLNERFLVHVLKTGVSVGSQEVVHLGEEEKYEVQVTKEEVTKAIKEMTTVPALAELNFVVIPLLSTSHLIPLADMAKLLAQQGVTVTLVTTALNAARFTAAIDHAIRFGLVIRVVELQFKGKEAGLPEGCENHNDVPGLNYRRQFFAAIEMLQEQTEKLLEDMKPKLSCIISDAYVAWTADKFQIPRIVFDGMSCFNQMCKHNMYILKDQNKIPESGTFVIPDLPDRIEVTKAQLPAHFNPAGAVSIQDIRDKIRAAEKRAYGVVINTFEELEQRYVDKFRRLKDGRVWCIGPLSLCNNDNLDKVQRGNKGSFDKEDILKKWLDSWEPETVVYACFGSLGRITVVQFVELALGLEESEEWISKNGFEERTKESGVLIRGWSPQVVILSHPAVGGFLTHCGWNSTVEGISLRVLDLKQLCIWGEEEKFGVQVSNNVVTDAIKKVMNKEKEENKIRKRARELGEMAKRAVEGGGSSYLNVMLLIKEIQEFQLNQSAKNALA